jgi:magnesium transporter
MLRIYTRQADRLAPVAIPTATGDSPAFDPAAATWFDLLNPTPGEDRMVEHCMGLSVPTMEEMQEIEPSARLYTENAAEFMTLTAVTDLDTDNPVKTPITFILKGNSLVTVRYADPRPFAVFTTRVQKPGGIPFSTGEMLMLGLLETMVDRLADVLERAGDEIDAISRGVFRTKVSKADKKTANLQSVIEQIGRRGDLLTLARESLVSMTRLLSYHQALESSNHKPSKDARQKIKVIQRDVASLSDHATFLSNKINFLLDATLGLINLEQNQIIKIFSVAAVVFLPPTLVASIYGMNFKNQPELEWTLGYPFALALMVASAVLPYLFFKRRGWL